MRTKPISDDEPRTYGIAIRAPGMALEPLTGGRWNLLAVEEDRAKAERKFMAAQRFLQDKGQIVVYSWPKDNISQLTADARFNCDRLPVARDIRTTDATIKAAFWFKVEKTVGEKTVQPKGPVGPAVSRRTSALVAALVAVAMSFPIGAVAIQAWAHWAPIVAKMQEPAAAPAP